MASSLTGKNNTKSYIGTQSKVKNIDPINELDRVNIYEFENGMDLELTNLGGELTTENIRKAQSKVLKNLKKDPAFYTNQIAEDTVKRFGGWGGGKKSGKYTNKKDAESVKADIKVKETKEEKNKDNEMKEISKVEKSNVSKDKKIKNPNPVNKVKQETYTAKKAKGIKSIMDLPGKEKKVSLKENYYRDAEKDDAAHIADLEKDMKFDAKSSMKKFTDPDRKSMFGKPDPKHDRKVKLTKENMNMIKEMVSEAVKQVKEAVALKDKAGNIQYAKDSTEASNIKTNAQKKGVQLTQSNV